MSGHAEFAFFFTLASIAVHHHTNAAIKLQIKMGAPRQIQSILRAAEVTMRHESHPAQDARTKG
jgi:hypothetical protein